MFVCVLILAASTIGVHSQCRAIPSVISNPGCYSSYFITPDQYESPPILPCDGIVRIMPTALPNMPAAIMPEIVTPVSTMPAMPFFTELPNCPDFCFNDVLTSPLGCLDPILNIYSTNTVCPLPELPVSPICETAVSSLAPLCSKLLPPVSDCDGYNPYQKREPIPPPFI